MATPQDEVMAFFEQWGTIGEMEAAFRQRLTPGAIWENVGFTRTVGADAAVETLQWFADKFAFVGGKVVVDHIAAVGNIVLTERTDIFLRADRSEAVSFKLMGVFEMDGPHILAWRDYFDTKQF